MREIISKQHKEYTKFLCDLSTWREGLKNGDLAPWKPNGKSENYKRYCDMLQKFTSLQSSLSTLNLRRIFIRDKKLVEVVKELKKLWEDLKRIACALIKEDTMYLFNPLVHLTILFHVREQDFLERLSEALKRKTKAKHGNRKEKSESIIFSIAVLMSQYPHLKKARHFHKLLDTPRVREWIVEEKEWHRATFEKWFKRNQAEIFSLRDRLTG